MFYETDFLYVCGIMNNLFWKVSRISDKIYLQLFDSDCPSWKVDIVIHLITRFMTSKGIFNQTLLFYMHSKDIIFLLY